MIALVRDIVESQHDRGPDHRTVETRSGPRGSIVLGHNRLSIIDLSAQANMPMWTPDGRWGIVFNGEIYNYIEIRAELARLGVEFRTQSDSEVLLQAFSRWGFGGLSRCNGMFAFAVYDSLEHRLFLARDRFGVKPLFVRRLPNGFAFASTSNVLASHYGLQPNLRYLSRGAAHWVFEDGTTETAFLGLEYLPPSRGLIAYFDSNGALRSRDFRYYDLRSRTYQLVDELGRETESALVDRVRHVLKDATALRLRSDVPVGVSLSGGLDSTTVSSLAFCASDKIMGFSYGTPDDDSTEGPVIESYSRLTGLPVTFVQPEPQESRDAFWKVIESQDAPFASASVVGQHFVYQAARAAGVKVLLGGQGADEAFMGYRKYLWFLLHRAVRSGSAGFLLGALRDAGPGLIAELPRIGTYWGALRRYVPAVSSRAPLLRGSSAASLIDIREKPRSSLRDRQILDIASVSLPTLLRYEDRNSMGNSIESRLPYMDYRLVELGVALPERSKVRNGYGKWALREAAKGLSPNSIRLARFKRGFPVNPNTWILGGLGEDIRERLRSRWNVLREFASCETRVDEAFSDHRLVSEPSSFVDAVTFCWLAYRL